MIKIIVSGTSDGFYPRYASDGVLNDEVSKQLLDRRRFLSRKGDRLYKTGYSFQILDNGILFHNIMLLFDGFGRDGFIMASLFLPEGELLSGSDIKEALDSVVAEYKVHTINGVSNFEIDWSFVERKANEINTKVHQMGWKKHPVKGDNLRMALIKGADERVAEYFQYPNPLHIGCAGYGLVFLTESLLDPAMDANSGPQGYNVLSQEQVDIDNPVYDIIYNNPQGYSTQSLKTTVSRKELAESDINCGVLNQKGFRTQPVFISKGTMSKDGVTIEVNLPDLIMKKSSVLISVKDANSGNEIPIDGCIINWRKEGSYGSASERVHMDKLFEFQREDCDTVWQVTVSYNNYRIQQQNVTIADGQSIETEIMLEPIPMWQIVIQYPQGESSLIPVRENFVESKVREEEENLEKNKLEVIKEEDKTNRIVTLKCKKKEETPKTVFIKPDSDNTELVNKNRKKDAETVYVIVLNNQSRNYSLFRNYREAKNDKGKAINKLKNFLTSTPDKYNKVKVSVGEILNKLENDEIVAASNDFEKISNEQPAELIANTEKAIMASKKFAKVPKVVYYPDNINYNCEQHQLETVVKGSNQPQSPNDIVLGKDKYEYSIKNSFWTPQSFSGNGNPVKRKFSSKYKILYSVIGLLIIAVCVSAIVLLSGYGDLKKQTHTITQNMSMYKERYCGDELYGMARKVDSTIVAQNKDGKQDWSNDFYEQFDMQTKYEKAAKEKFDEFMNMMNGINDNVLEWTQADLDNWEKLMTYEKDKAFEEDPLSHEQRKKLKEKLDVKKDSVQAADEQEMDEYNKIKLYLNEDLNDTKSKALQHYYRSYRDAKKYDGHVENVKNKIVIDGPESLFKALKNYDNIKNLDSLYIFEFKQELQIREQYNQIKNGIIAYVKDESINKKDYGKIYEEIEKKQTLYQKKVEQLKKEIEKITGKTTSSSGSAGSTAGSSKLSEDDLYINVITQPTPQNCNNYLTNYITGSYVNDVKNIIKLKLFEYMTHDKLNWSDYQKESGDWLEADDAIKSRIENMIVNFQSIEIDSTNYNSLKEEATTLYNNGNNDKNWDILTCLEEKIKEFKEKNNNK